MYTSSGSKAKLRSVNWEMCRIEMIEMLLYLRDLSGVRMPGQGKSLIGSVPGSEPGSAGSVWRFQFWHVTSLTRIILCW